MEATVLIKYLRDYPPEELEVWAKYGTIARQQGGSIEKILRPLNEELAQKGLLAPEQWAPIFDYLEQIKSNKNLETS